MRVIGRLVRVAAVVLVLVLAVGVALGALVGWITMRSQPETSGSIAIAGLDGYVAVQRDSNGIAQIYADTPHDLFMAQGYVHAQERLWQMEVWRHIGSGRLSELFGESQLETDQFIRALDWRGAAERDLAAMAPETVAALQAYADGVNAYVTTHKGSLGLPFVFIGVRAGLGGGLDGYTPEPWTPIDTAQWQKVQSWNLGGNYTSEVFRVLADAQLGGAARTDDLLPAYPTDGPIIAPTKSLSVTTAGAEHSATTATVSTAAVGHSSALTQPQSRRAGLARPSRPAGRQPLRVSTRRRGWRLRMASGPTTGSSDPNAARPGERCSRTIHTSASECRPSGT